MCVGLKSSTTNTFTHMVFMHVLKVQGAFNNIGLDIPPTYLEITECLLKIGITTQSVTPEVAACHILQVQHAHQPLEDQGQCHYHPFLLPSILFASNVDMDG